MRAGKAGAREELFLRACATGDVIGVITCIERGVDPNTADSQGVFFLFTLPDST